MAKGDFRMELAIAHRSEKRRQENRGETDEKTAKHHEASIKDDVAIDESDAALHHSPAVNVASFRRILYYRCRWKHCPHSCCLFPRGWTKIAVADYWRNAIALLVVLIMLLLLWNRVFPPVWHTDRGVVRVPKYAKNASALAKNSLAL